MDFYDPYQEKYEKAYREAKLSLRFLQLQWKFDRFEEALRALEIKAGFDPAQPRVPSGQSGGGQWSGDGSAPPNPHPDPGIAEESYGLDALIGMAGAGVMSLGDAAMSGARAVAQWFQDTNIPSTATLAEESAANQTVPPRPDGIPEDWEVKPAEDGKGWKYIQPGTTDGSYVRTSSGNPDSPILVRRRPFIKWQKFGNSMDQYGNYVDKNSSEAHISPNDFSFIKEFFQ